VLEISHKQGFDIVVCNAACAGGHLPCVQYVAESKTQWHDDIVRCCARHGHFECVKLIIRYAGRTDMRGLDVAFWEATPMDR